MKTERWRKRRSGWEEINENIKRNGTEKIKSKQIKREIERKEKRKKGKKERRKEREERKTFYDKWT